MPPAPANPGGVTAGTPWRFDATPRPAGSRPDPTDLDRDRGLWAFEAFLPVESRVTLGEGVTPLVDAPPVGGDYRYTVRRIITIGPTPASRITETGRPTRRSRGPRGRSDR